MMAETQTTDGARTEAFGERMLAAVNDTALILMTSLGHRVGLFDALARLEPSTSDEIAATAGLEERYVREWLGAMVAGRVVEYDPSARAYVLPPEHAAVLTRAAGPDNLAAFAAYMPMLASVEGEVAACFRRGGGVPYESFPRLQQLMAEEMGPVYDATLVDRTLPSIPGLAASLEAGIEVADVGCGAGHAINLMAQAFPASRFTGYDISEAGIGLARAEAARLGLTNAGFELRDLAQLDEPDRFHLITAFDAIHDQVKPALVLAAIARALRAGGTFLMVDFAASSNLEDNLEHPLGPTLYTFSTMHCMTVSLAHGGAGLGTAWGEQKALQMLADAGFDQVDVTQVEGDLYNNYYVARASRRRPHPPHRVKRTLGEGSPLARPGGGALL
jgi:SAM-dependent methyltransferase